jgi:hypothetical protein
MFFNIIVTFNGIFAGEYNGLSFLERMYFHSFLIVMEVYA